MGLKVSKLSPVMIDDILEKRYEIYKIQDLSKYEYLKVLDLKDLKEK